MHCARHLASPRARAAAQGIVEERRPALARQAGENVVAHAQGRTGPACWKVARCPPRGRDRTDLSQAAAVEHDRPAIGAIDAVEDVEDRTLSRAVRTDQGADLAARSPRSSRVERLQASEGE